MPKRLRNSLPVTWKLELISTGGRRDSLQQCLMIAAAFYRKYAAALAHGGTSTSPMKELGTISKWDLVAGAAQQKAHLGRIQVNHWFLKAS